jgi:hypothetical protein
MLVYSFLKAGDYGGVVWQFSWEGWFNVFMQRDIFSEELTFVDAHLWIFGRSITLSLLTTISALILGLPTAYFIATRPPASRNFWLFLITIPFWTNLLIRTFAIMELIRAQGTINTTLTGWELIDQPLDMLYTNFAIMLGMTYVYLPLMVLPIYASMEKFDFRLVEAGLRPLRQQVSGADEDHPAAGQAGADCRIDPGVRAVAGRLCNAARAGRRQEHDAGQPDRAAVRTGPQLAAGCSACHYLADHRDGGAVVLCAHRAEVWRAAWLR